VEVGRVMVKEAPCSGSGRLGSVGLGRDSDIGGAQGLGDAM
jgi:hypothetical protein